MVIFTVISSLIGFLTSGLPSVLKYFQDKQDKAHELAMLQMQIAAQKDLEGEKLQEIQVQNNATTLQSAIELGNKSTGIHWIDGLNGVIRPILTLTFVGIYLAMKFPHIELLLDMVRDPDHFGSHEMYLKTYNFISNEVWDHTDNCVFASLISYWFGSKINDRN